MAKTNVKISRESCNINGNVFCLISTAHLALGRNGHKSDAVEMQNRIDKEAESPRDVLKIVEEYVTLI